MYILFVLSKSELNTIYTFELTVRREQKNIATKGVVRFDGRGSSIVKRVEAHSPKMNLSN